MAVSIQIAYPLDQKLHPPLSHSSVDIPSFHPSPIYSTTCACRMVDYRAGSKIGLPVLIPSTPTLPVITLDKLLESV